MDLYLNEVSTYSTERLQNFIALTRYLVIFGSSNRTEIIIALAFLVYKKNLTGM
jgi:hypothetical protein